jgi:ATP-dependent Clp protease adaptor protein ClpS
MVSESFFCCRIEMIYLCKKSFVMSHTETDILEEILIKEELVEERSLIVYNDDVNTFDHVIESLVKICKHDLVQAEQCTYIIHYKGKCDVKTGDFETLRPMCEALLDKGISAKIH